MLKRSVLLATGFAVALAVGVPLLGGAGAVVGAPDQPLGTIVFSASAPATSAAGAAASSSAKASSVKASSVKALGASPTAGSSSTSAPGEAVRSNSAIQSDATARSTGDSVQSIGSTDTRTNATARSINREPSRTGRSAPGVTARLSANGHSIVRQSTKSSDDNPTPPSDPSPPKTCPGNVGGTPSSVPGGGVTDDGLQGTTNADLASFALEYNKTRVEHCLPPIPLSNIRFDKCLQDRMFWIAEDPSTNPASAWGHSVPRSDGAKIKGCDGDIAGGMGDTGTTAADKWWDSTDHRASLYQPKWGDDSYSNVCIGFAISHGGIPNDPAAFSRESARWEDCSTFGK